MGMKGSGTLQGNRIWTDFLKSFTEVDPKHHRQERVQNDSKLKDRQPRHVLTYVRSPFACGTRHLYSHRSGGWHAPSYDYLIS